MLEAYMHHHPGCSHNIYQDTVPSGPDWVRPPSFVNNPPIIPSPIPVTPPNRRSIPPDNDIFDYRSDPMLLAFFEIDRNGDEVITPREMREYANRHHANEESFTRRWIKSFSLDGDNKVTLEEFCRALGYDVNLIRGYRQERYPVPIRGVIVGAGNVGSGHRFPSHVQILSSDIDDEKQYDIVNTMVDYMAREDERGSAKSLKHYLDTKYGRTFHVIILIGQFWAYYSHEPRVTLHFKVGRHVVLVFKTPEY